MSAWWNEDGKKFADIVYSKLLEKGELSFNEIIEIYDKLDFPMFRKAEGVAWDILNSKDDIERFKDGEFAGTGVNKFGLKLIK